jgi:hypothetical protein
MFRSNVGPYYTCRPPFCATLPHYDVYKNIKRHLTVQINVDHEVSLFLGSTAVHGSGRTTAISHLERSGPRNDIHEITLIIYINLESVKPAVLVSYKLIRDGTISNIRVCTHATPGFG